MPASRSFSACVAVAATLASLPAAAMQGDAAAGSKVYERCAGCHALAYDRTGPRHCGLFGRRAGSVAGFAYSDAMKAAGFDWNERTLHRFLADPIGSMPGTSMGYAGVPDARERADLIAYLRSANDSPDCKE